MNVPAPQRPRPFRARRILALVVAVACGWVAYALYGAAATDHAALARVTQLQEANAALTAQIAQRSQEVSEAQGTAWLEDQARKLGYHLPGEKVYVLDPGAKSAPASGGLNAPPPTFSPTPVPTPIPSATPTPSPSPAGPTLVPLSPTPAATSPSPAATSPSPVATSPSPAH
ncbi:MAG: septum formation initiator family protein [Candidatus Dormibacteria bacterium]|jgi:cell division protein FtsB